MLEPSKNHCRYLLKGCGGAKLESREVAIQFPQNCQPRCRDHGHVHVLHISEEQQPFQTWGILDDEVLQSEAFRTRSPEHTPMLLRLGDTIWARGQPWFSSRSKLSRTGQPASSAWRELPEILACKRLSCLRSGRWSAPAASPSAKLQPPKLAARRVGEKRRADAGSGGGSGRRGKIRWKSSS